MRHEAVRELLEDTVKTLSDRIAFGYGRLSDFNKIPNKKYPYIWSDPFQITGNTYSVTISFLDLDSDASTEKDYQKILDAMHDLAQQFYYKLNLSDFDNSDLARATDKIELTEPQYTRVLKDHADTVSGWVVSFTITTPDEFEYCSIYD